jgi:hypothetical protein
VGGQVARRVVPNDLAIDSKLHHRTVVAPAES